MARAAFGVSPVERPARGAVRIFESAEQLRSWFQENHEARAELWIGFYKKGVPKRAMTYPDAVEEALCFGWIDGITYRIDDEVRAIRFTPRRKTSSWSAVNLAKVADLLKAGRMHPAGIRAHEERDRRRDASYSYERPPEELPAEWLARFEADTAAWAHWQSEQPYYRRTATHWVVSAKRQETRERRFEALLSDSAGGRRVRPFRIGSSQRASSA